ncbi:MAG: MFS transporter [Gammaproteobacteria bacterium]
MNTATNTPYARLSGFYFAYFAAVGAMAPYFSPYLRSLGYSPAQIGQATATLMVGRILAPGIWGWLADKRGNRLRMVQSTSLLAAIVLAFIFVASTYLRMLLVLLCFGLFWSAALPQFEAITLNHLGSRVHDYTRVRLWGSVGFIITASVLGYVLQGKAIAWLPTVLVSFATIVWLTAQTIPPEPATRSLIAPHLKFTEVMRRRGVATLFAVVFLMQLSFGPYYAFYTIFLEEHGYSRSVAGLLWSLGVTAEVVLFAFLHRLQPVWGLKRMMLTSLAAGILRWLLVGYSVKLMAVIVFAQLLHAATFGMQHAAAVQYIHRYFVGRHQGRGQALYSSIAYGVGGAISAFSSGYLWSLLGAHRTFAIASSLCAAGLVVAWLWLEEDPARDAVTVVGA